MSKITEILEKTTDESKKDMAWLLNRGFELDEEQYYGYCASASVTIGKYNVTILASRHYKSDGWSVSFIFEEDILSRIWFKFSNGETNMKAKRVKDALDKAYTEIMSVKSLKRTLKAMKVIKEVKL